MRERTELEERLGSLARFERELEDAVTLVELGESENDAATEKEGLALLKALETEAQRRQIEALLSGEVVAKATLAGSNPAEAGREARVWALWSIGCIAAGAGGGNTKGRGTERRPGKE